MNKISNERMSAFLETIISQVRTALFEREFDILKAWQENIEEASENEKDFPPMKLGIGSTVDLEKNTIETVLSFTVKHQSKISEALPDPSQPEFPEVKEMAKAMAKNLKKAGVKITVN
jgi:hypothetical protein